MKFRLSIQAQKAIMLAVNKGMLAAAFGKPKEECDISQILAGFSLENDKEELFVLNPPINEYDMLVNEMEGQD